MPGSTVERDGTELAVTHCYSEIDAGFHDNSNLPMHPCKPEALKF